MQSYWSQVLRVPAEDIGTNDDFFKAGGDSIMAVQLVSLLRDHSRTISAADVFNSPDLATLASQLELATPLAPETNVEAVANDLGATPAFSLIGNEKRIARFFSYLKEKNIPLKSVQDAYPTTALQESLISLSARDAGAYVSSSVFQLPSTVNVERFQQAWDKVIAYNEILRTRIISFDADGMVQVVLSQHPVKWQIGTCLKRYLDTADVQLDVKSDLIRYALIRNGKSSPLYFVLTMHHAVYDGWSTPLLFRQVDQAYAQQPIVKPPRFAEFIRHLQSCSPSVMREFWAQKLDDCEKATDLPLLSSQYTPTPDSANTSCAHSATLFFETPFEWRVSPSVFIRAAWSLVIHWYTGGSPDVMFGASIAGRNADVRGIELMVAPTLATIPIRVRLEPEMTLKQICQNLMDDMIDTIPYEHIGLQNIQAMNGDLKRLCNFNSLLVIQPPTTDQAITGLFTQPHNVADKSRKLELPLVLECTPREHTLDVQATFNPKVVSRTQIKRMIKTLEHALSELLINGDKKLSQVQPASHSDREEMKVWNSAVTPTTVQDTTQTALEASLYHYAETQALYTSTHQLNYRHIDEYSRRICAYLNSLGVGPGIPVLLCFEKSIWHTVALASVIRAGGAFVPLDPFMLPESRLRYIVAQAEVKVTMVSEATAHLVPHIDGVERIELSEAMVHALKDPCWQQVPQRALPSSPMYIIFTSGTTGLPKGVIISHQAYMSVLKPKRDLLGITSSSRVLQSSSHAFDLTVDGILLPLLCGGCVCVPDEESRLANLDNFILESRANHADMTPWSAFMLNEDIVSKSLRCLVLGGEKMGRVSVEKWADKLTLINLWGATESVNNASCRQIGPAQVSSSSNIGRPFQAFTWIVDPNDHSRLLPIGATGELCIQGPGLADGYIKNRERTEAVFVSPPSWAQHGLPYKMYRTGDLARYEEDGTVIFVGRKDRQIKVRGQLVEPAEVEQRIQEIPDLVSAHFMVDLAPKNHFENDALILYTSAANDDVDYNLVLRRVAENLSSVLPQYMIPSWLLPMVEMPLTVNGKIDHAKVLEAAAQMNRSSYVQVSRAVEFAEPQTPTEMQMQSLWASTLKIESSAIGRLDNFFYLGGDSIAAMRLAVSGREAGLRFTVQDIFKEQTLERVAKTAADRRQKDSQYQQGGAATEPRSPDENLAAIAKEAIQKLIGYSERSAIDRIVPATDWQAWCIGQSALASGGWRNTFIIDLGVERLDRARLRAALNDLIRRHDILRTCFIAYKGNVYQAVMKFHEGNFQIQALEKMGGPCLPAGALPLETFLDEATGRLYFRISHAQYDGLCLPMIYRDLSRLYYGVALGATAPFYPLAEASQASALPAAVSYWSQALADAPLTSLVNHKIPSVDNLLDAAVSCKILPIKMSERDSNFTATPATVLKSAWAVTLFRLLGTNDVVFGSLAQTRTIDLPNPDSIVGPCLNIVPVRAKISVDAPLNEVLAQIQEQHISSMPHNRLGFSSIISNCTKWPAWARFSSVVQYQNISHVSEDPRLSTSEKKMDAGNHVPMADCSDVWVIALPQPDHLEVTIQLCTRIMGRDIAQRVLDLLCANISRITTSAGAACALENLPGDVARHFPLAAHDKTKPCQAPNMQYWSQTRPDMHTLVRDSWQQVFGHEDTSREEPFWDVWGNAMAAAQLAKCYTSSLGVSVTPEDVYSHPTMAEQVNFLSSKVKTTVSTQ